MRILRLGLLSCLLLAPLACNHLAKVPGVLGYESVVKAQAQITAIQRDGDAKLAALQAQIDVQRAAMVTTWKAQIQEAANHLFTSQMAFVIDPTPTPNELIMHEEDVAAGLTLPPPDAATVAHAMDQVKKLLADKQHLIDNLNLAAAQAKTRADQLAAQEKTEETQIATLAAQKDQVVHDTGVQVAAAQSKLKTVTDKVLAKDQELLSNKAEITVLKTKLTIGAAILAALFGIAAAFSPLMRLQLIELAVSFGAVALAIPFVQAWMVAAGLGVLLIIVAWHFVATHTKVVNLLPDPLPVAITPPKTP